MKHGSTHSHSTGSDGKLSPEAVVKKTIKLGWSYVYFTDHYKVPEILKFDYYRGFFSDEYISSIKKLKEKHYDKIAIYFGGEFDFIKDHLSWTKKEIGLQDYDYVLGSIHKLKFKEDYFDIEDGKEKWIKTAELFGGTKKYILEYYAQVKLLIKSGVFDSLAHMDYIKVYNEDEELFSEQSDWYKTEINEVLRLLKKHKMALEINHGGLRKCKETFPSAWILKEAQKLGVPITLGLDAHYDEHYSNENMETLIKAAKKAGYNEIAIFKKRKMTLDKI
jgi:histidinol-phosphatase (PHP family)